MACEIKASATTVEPEILIPVKCPLCSQESLTGFRISVAADALESGEIRLYANCHIVSWDASVTELATIRAYLDANWSTNLQEACRSFCDLDGLPGKESFRPGEAISPLRSRTG
jgi:hypothetical protein